MIPYGRQTIEEDDIQIVVDVLRSDYLTTGPKVAEFEKLVADYVGAKYAVAISNDTAALHAACHAAGIGPGDEVITTPITFAASSNCVLYCGGTPVFADVDSKTYNIDPEDIKRKITGKTKAIIPVHLAGQPCDMDEIHAIAKEHHLIVIEDAAHALGSEYKGKMIGSMSDMTTFSFHPVKPITTGEGGMIVTNDETLYKKLVLFRSHGITRDESPSTVPTIMQKMPSRPQNPATAAGIRSVPSPKRSNTKRRNAWRPEIFSFDENIIPCTPFYLVFVSNIHPYFNFSFTRSSRRA